MKKWEIKAHVNGSEVMHVIDYYPDGHDYWDLYENIMNILKENTSVEIVEKKEE